MARRLGGGLWLVLVAARALAAAPATSTLLEEARTRMRVLTDSVQTIERIAVLADGRAVRASCAAEKLAEARAGVQIGSGEVAIVQENLDAPAAPDEAHRDRAKEKQRAEDIDHALARLGFLADRARELIRAARICADEDRSGITVTRVEVQIAPAVPEGDPTALPGPGRPAPDRPGER